MGCGSAQPHGLPMNDLKTLGERIDALEARLMFQDETIETLNKTITEQWVKIDALTRRVTALTERLQEAETQLPRSNESPPHY
jgi:SlyX protein